jgi:chemotaxis signal transduction protein
VSATVTQLSHLRELVERLPTTIFPGSRGIGLGSYELRPLLLGIIDAQLKQEAKHDAYARDRFQKQRKADEKSLGYTEAALADIERELEEA